MDWMVAGSAFAGSFLGIVVIVLGVVIWDYFDRKKSAAVVQEKTLPRAKDLHDDVLERHLEELVVTNFDQLFPGWAIYSTNALSAAGSRPTGVRYRTPAGEIDLLCTDEDNNKENRVPSEKLGFYVRSRCSSSRTTRRNVSSSESSSTARRSVSLIKV